MIFLTWTDIHTIKMSEAIASYIEAWAKWFQLRRNFLKIYCWSPPTEVTKCFTQGLYMTSSLDTENHSSNFILQSLKFNQIGLIRWTPDMIAINQISVNTWVIQCQWCIYLNTPASFQYHSNTTGYFFGYIVSVVFLINPIIKCHPKKSYFSYLADLFLIKSQSNVFLSVLIGKYPENLLTINKMWLFLTHHWIHKFEWNHSKAVWVSNSWYIPFQSRFEITQVIVMILQPRLCRNNVRKFIISMYLVKSMEGLLAIFKYLNDINSVFSVA